jgi:predicted CXXCH cytochrome family protein
MNNGKRKVGFFLLAALFYLVIGCSHKVVTFFFDGVPSNQDSLTQALNNKPALPDTLKSTAMVEPVVKQSVYFHPPYQNKKCKICHDPSSPVKLVQEQPDLCYNCHDDFATAYTELHGPVGGGFCTACHSPHQSENKKLLLRTGQALCLFCHESKKIFSEEEHSAIGSTDCQECHNPHGSAKKHLLK